MSGTQIEGAYDTIHVPASADGYVQARNRRAARNLAAFALDHDRPAEWLTEMLDILGLRQAYVSVTARLVEIEPGAQPGRIARKAAAKSKPAAVKNADPGRDIPHGTRRGYNTYNCRCQSCRQANMEYNADRRAAAAGDAA